MGASCFFGARTTLSTSSRRRPGPIATGGCSYGRSLTPYPNDTARRMGPGVRRDDELSVGRNFAFTNLPQLPNFPAPHDLWLVERPWLMDGAPKAARKSGRELGEK